MPFKRFVLLFSLLIITVLWLIPASAQEGASPLAEGLMNPRNFSFDSEGNAYVAEAGVGGPLLTVNDDAYGNTSQISMISPDGEVSVIVKGLISYREGNSLGAHAVQVTDDSIWMLLGETTDFSIPYSHALVRLDRENRRIQQWIDLLALELNADPDGNPNQEANATDFVVAPDGTIYIANAGCNCLMSWTEADGLQVAVSWPYDSGNPETDNPVPTSVEIGPDGDLYVGFLTGFPFPQGGSRIERWRGGELVETYPGLTAVTGLLVTEDGTIYASEFGTFEMGAGWGPGRVVTVSSEGITPVMEDLAFPFGLAQAPDGTIYVATGSQGGPDGAIIPLPAMDM